MDCYLGIDVGTGSARAGLFSAEGGLLAHHSREIRMWRPAPDYAEQSTTDIWNAIAACCREVRQASGVAAAEVKGIGIDATCSLAVVAADGTPVLVSPTGEDEQNVIVWLDHRALAEADIINNQPEREVLRYLGGKISPEMGMPKLLWLKKHLPETWRRAAHFFDLPDYLTHRATGSLTRSNCSLACKMTYLAHRAEAGSSGWDVGFLSHIGLNDLAKENYARIGSEVSPVGKAVGSGLTEAAARDLGLEPGTPVGVSMIDAHCGGVGMLGIRVQEDEPVDFDRRLALIGGTSSCHMAVSRDQRAVPGVWGPYWSAMVPGHWLNEGGQSATGALIDHIVFSHGASDEAKRQAEEVGVSIYEWLNRVLERMADGGDLTTLTRELHVCPYFHGNRSPRADPHLRGMVSGLKLSATVEDLARLYLATVQAIAYGTRHIIEAMNGAGYAIDTLICCGGGTKNPVFLQAHADATRCRLVLPAEPEAVLLGGAMLGAVACGAQPSLEAAMAAMARPGRVIKPAATTAEFHEAKYRVFHRMYDDQMTYQAIMESSN